MKSTDFNKESLLAMIAGVLEGDLTDADGDVLNALLKESPEARRIYRSHMELHARLHLDYAGAQAAAHMPGSAVSKQPARFPIRWLMAGAAAACLALLALIAWPSQPDSGQFATVENVRGARWDSGDLPTAEGSRIGRGTLRLVEGLATLRFDSGAELTIEAPAELHLTDAMHCVLTKGVAVANVPDSAIGFRIETPSAQVVDYGTRFSVTVDAATGKTFTQVYEGLVEVEHRTSGEVVSLKAGQMNSTSEKNLGGAQGPKVTTIIGPLGRGPDWALLETSKDAYIGHAYLGDVEVHRSETLLLVKNGDVHRKAYLGFDLANIDPERLAEAELMLHFEPTGWGVASVVPDATFSVYGLVLNEPWDEFSLEEETAPANKWIPNKPDELPTGDSWLDHSKVHKLGTFSVAQGVQTGPFGITGDALAGFLREHAGAEITLIVARDTAELETNGLVHGFASRRHPTLRPPTLAIRLQAP